MGDLENAKDGIPSQGGDTREFFYRWWLPSCVLVELIVLMMRFNCSINHVLEHQEHCEGVFLVTISVERRKLNNGII